MITALVERWRPETHTFHLPVGEATITLQDVEVLLGLKVDGRAVVGRCLGAERDWVGLWESLLGFTPANGDIDGYKMRIRALQPYLADPLSEDATDEQVQQRARMYILVLLGGLLFTDTSGKHMPLYFLEFVADFTTCGTYSWGNAVLACLYRNLCKACKVRANDIGGATLLLQVYIHYLSILLRIW